MYPTISAAIANERHASMVNDAENYRRARTARAARSTKVRPERPVGGSAGRRGHAISRPIGAFYSWLAAGQL